eukprot:GEMP01030128.1.p1 GENE.GEMP01030128.1~~GEMP01030128.1.p1  ORF type:complete len:304 (+),score=73.88 GEMP01030128.1:393-1304(+)
MEYFVAECIELVKLCQTEHVHTQEGIQERCSTRKNALPRCDFFGEALSLASSHSAFDGQTFCDNFRTAIFCSRTMNKVLSSLHVADIAYGECMRDKSVRAVDEQYCLKFQRMLAFAVGNEDLDTMRACYMIEAYAELDGSMSQKNQTSPLIEERILDSASGNLNSFEKAKVDEKEKTEEKEPTIPLPTAEAPNTIVEPASKGELNKFGSHIKSDKTLPAPRAEKEAPLTEEPVEKPKEPIVAEPEYHKKEEETKKEELRPTGDHVPIFGHAQMSSSIIVAPMKSAGSDKADNATLTATSKNEA